MKKKQSIQPEQIETEAKLGPRLAPRKFELPPAKLEHRGGVREDYITKSKLKS